ncbi:MAG: hypothetical protein J0L64_19225 [Acidobacteria bacterium]|nr:hypothetical protein [Acidobacteriota bacterium]
MPEEAGAKAAVAARQGHLSFVVSNWDEFDLGADRWDLPLSIHRQDWHLNSKTNMFDRIGTVLKRRELILIEGFAPPSGLSPGAIRRQFEGFVRAGEQTDPAAGNLLVRETEERFLRPMPAW